MHRNGGGAESPHRTLRFRRAAVQFGARTICAGEGNSVWKPRWCGSDGRPPDFPENRENNREFLKFVDRSVGNWEFAVLRYRVAFSFSQKLYVITYTTKLRIRRASTSLFSIG